MTKNPFKNIGFWQLNLLTISLVILLSTSCVPVKKLKYVRDTKETIDYNDFINERTEKRIESYDNLYIQVYSLDRNTAELLSNSDNAGARVDLNLISYTVNDSGYINYPFVGDVNLKGLTIQEATVRFEKLINQYLPNTSVTVKFVGNYITVIGEVNRPGEYSFYNEKITVFQALGLAGGIDDFGNKTNVTLIREIDNNLSYHRLDLSDKTFVESPYYYLNPNDVLIIDPVRAKYRTLRDWAPVTILLSTVTTAIAVLTLVRTY